MQNAQRYEDILHRKRPESARHRPMQRADRAAQFSPFAALVGLDMAITETARIRTQQVENDAYTDDMLLWDMEVLASQLETMADDAPEAYMAQESMNISGTACHDRCRPRGAEA